MIAKRLGLTAIALLSFGLALEAAVRLEDWIRYGTPPFVNALSQSDLITTDSMGTHGRPNGRFRKWTLDSLGFRGPDVPRVPDPGTIRIVVTGASETFRTDRGQRQGISPAAGRLPERRVRTGAVGVWGGPPVRGGQCRPPRNAAPDRHRGCAGPLGHHRAIRRALLPDPTAIPRPQASRRPSPSRRPRGHGPIDCARSTRGASGVSGSRSRGSCRHP